MIPKMSETAKRKNMPNFIIPHYTHGFDSGMECNILPKMPSLYQLRAFAILKVILTHLAHALSP